MSQNRSQLISQFKRKISDYRYSENFSRAWNDKPALYQAIMALNPWEFLLLSSFVFRSTRADDFAKFASLIMLHKYKTATIDHLIGLYEKKVKAHAKIKDQNEKIIFLNDLKDASSATYNVVKLRAELMFSVEADLNLGESTGLDFKKGMKRSAESDLASGNGKRQRLHSTGLTNTASDTSHSSSPTNFNATSTSSNFLLFGNNNSTTNTPITGCANALALSDDFWGKSEKRALDSPSILDAADSDLGNLEAALKLFSETEDPFNTLAVSGNILMDPDFLDIDPVLFDEESASGMRPF